MGTLRVDVEQLITAAFQFDLVAEKLRGARKHAEDGVGKGKAFGLLGAASGRHHDDFINQMVAALAAGGETAGTFRATLVAVAKDFGATDQDIHDRFRKLERIVEGVEHT